MVSVPLRLVGFAVSTGSVTWEHCSCNYRLRQLLRDKSNPKPYMAGRPLKTIEALNPLRTEP